MSGLRSAWAVFAGLLAIFILTTLVDVLLHASGVFPPWGQPMPDALFGLATAYRILFGIAGGFITARLAPDRPMMHAMILAAIGTVLSIIGAAVTWGKGPQFGPKWYALAVIAISIPCCWIGARLLRKPSLAAGY